MGVCLKPIRCWPGKKNTPVTCWSPLLIYDQSVPLKLSCGNIDPQVRTSAVACRVQDELIELMYKMTLIMIKMYFIQFLTVSLTKVTGHLDHFCHWSSPKLHWWAVKVQLCQHKSHKTLSENTHTLPCWLNPPVLNREHLWFRGFGLHNSAYCCQPWPASPLLYTGMGTSVAMALRQRLSFAVAWQRLIVQLGALSSDDVISLCLKS